MQNESIVLGQGKWIGGQLIKSRIFQTQRRLNISAGLLLRQNVGDVIGAESTGRVSLRQGLSNGIRTVVADEREQLADLPGQRPIGGG